MGVELANECVSRGAEVTLVLGPSQLTPDSDVNLIRVRSGDEMLEACVKHHQDSDICIFSAAVADYKPASISDKKIKKSDDTFELALTKTTDIAYTLGQQKRKDQIHVGFALETNNEKLNAEGKLKKKNFNMVVLNSLRDKGAGFGLNTNKITIFTDDNQEYSFDLKTKKEVAADIINTLKNRYLSS